MGTDNKPKFLLIDPDQINTVVSTKYAIDGLLVLKESTFIFGPPKHLKTALSWLLSIATGRDWFGHKVRQLKVLYFNGEGVDPFIGRIKAWQAAHNVPNLEQYFKIVQQVPNLFDGSIETTIKEIKSQGFVPDVVAIDTLGRAMGAAKETTEDFNTIFSYIDALMKEHLPGLTLVVIGHTRKENLIYRGPQVIAGDCDNLIYVERIGKEYKANVHCEFSRNAAEFDDFGFACIKFPVITDEGPQAFLAVTDLTTAHEIKAEENIEELAWRTLAAFYKNEETWTQQTVWFETTKAARPNGKLGNSTFSDATKELVRKQRVRRNALGLYQVVLDATTKPAEDLLAAASSSRSPRSSSHSYSPSQERGVGGVREDRSGSTPGVPGVNSRESRTDENSVASVPDYSEALRVAAEALKQIDAKKKPAA